MPVDACIASSSRALRPLTLHGVSGLRLVALQRRRERRRGRLALSHRARRRLLGLSLLGGSRSGEYKDWLNGI